MVDTKNSPLYIIQLIIDPRSRKVQLNGEDINLTAKEFDVLFFMAQHLGWAMTKEQIYNAVWKEELLYSEHTITDTIYRLRKKLKCDVSSNILQTVWGYGYRLIS